MLFLRIIQHLLPDARAWRITVDKKLRQFFAGLASTGSDIKDFADDVYEDTFPDTTRELDLWESQWALPSVPSLTTQERRDRITAAWRALGGQGPDYLQSLLQDAGFDVIVTSSVVDPISYTATTVTVVQCGAENSQCGDAEAECGGSEAGQLLDRLDPNDYLYDGANAPTTILAQCGATLSQCGGQDVSQCGETDELQDGYPLVNKLQIPDPVGSPGDYVARDYLIQNTAAGHAYFIYISADPFPTPAQIPLDRKAEFETLCLKICPAQQWLGMIVEYV